MAQRVAFNTTDSPVVYDDDGHSVPGLDRTEVDSTSPVVKQAIKTGRLVYVDDGNRADDFDVSGSARAVLDRVGDDPEKAQAAIEAENATESPRPTLLTQLGRIAQADDEKGN